VQLVVPHEAVRARVVGTVHVVGVAGNIERRRTVKVLRWVVVDIGELEKREIISGRTGQMGESCCTYQTVDVHDSNVRAWELLHDLGQVRRLVLENSVDKRNVFEHLVADLGDVARLIRPILRSFQTSLTRETVLWRQLQRRHVLQDKVAAAIVVDALDRSKNAVGVIGDAGAGYLGIRDEGVVTKIVRSDEDAVHGLVWWVVHEFGSIHDVFGVGDVGGDFVLLNGREEIAHGPETAWGNIIVADGARHRVVINVGTRVLRDVLRPWASA
jgi:hypothetical protein